MRSWRNPVLVMLLCIFDESIGNTLSFGCDGDSGFLEDSSEVEDEPSMLKFCCCVCFIKHFVVCVSNFHCTRDIAPKRVTSGEVHFRSITPGKHCSKET